MIALAEVAGLGKEPARRAFKACHYCKLSKRSCGNFRPCLSCCARGLECKEFEQRVVRNWICTEPSPMFLQLTEISHRDRKYVLAAKKRR